MSSHKIILPVILVIIIVSVIGWLIFHTLSLPIHSACLADNEYADYPLDPKYATSTLIPKSPLVISIRDKDTKQETSSFQVDNVFFSYHPVEIHECNIYVIKQFNYDRNKAEYLSGFKTELWQYSYDGIGKKILTLSEKKNDNVVVYYSYDFRVNPQGEYMVLIKSYFSQPDHALVIKNIATMDDVLVLKLTDLIKQYSGSIAGSFGLDSWVKDDKYFFGNIYNGTLDTAYYRIEVETWKTDIYLSPPELIGGVERQMNYYNGGYLAYVDIPIYVGFQEVYDQIIQQAKKEGKKKNLFVYNFATKQTTLVASTDPDKKFDLQWISDTQLQYALPSGEKKIYTIGQ